MCLPTLCRPHVIMPLCYRIAKHAGYMHVSFEGISLAVQSSQVLLHCSIGKLAKFVTATLTLGDALIFLGQSLKYLGVTINCGKSLSFRTDLVRRSFFSVCNCIYARRTCQGPQ